MDWKNRFNTEILERGKYYYQHKHVYGLSSKRGIYTANVIGSSVYHVETKIQNGDITYIMCTCPHARKGYYCKHMAAVLFALEARGDLAKQMESKLQEKMIKPFVVTDDTYRYFDMGKIASELKVEESKVKDAQSFIESGKIILESVETGYYSVKGEVALTAIANGRIKDAGGERRIICIFDRNNIVRAECNVLECGHYYYESYGNSNLKVCVHQLALLYLVDEYLKKYNPGDTTDHAAKVLLYGFRNKQNMVFASNQEEILDFRLEAVLEKERSGLYLSLKVGTEKLYVVKNITELVNKYEGRESILFGTKTTINLATHRISEDSKRVYEFVSRIVREEQSRIKHARESYNFYYGGEEIKNRLTIYGKRLDELFDLYEGKEIICNDKSKRQNQKTACIFQEGKPNLSLTIEKDVDYEQTFHGIYVSGKVPNYIRGEQYLYYFTKTAFCRIGKETTESLMPLLEIGMYGDISFYVGRKNLSEFYHQVLPVLKQSVKIKEPDAKEIEEFIPPDAAFAFYLDADKGMVACKAKVRYGEEMLSLLDQMRGEVGTQWYRNLNKEKEVLYRVKEMFPIQNLDRDELYCEESEEAVANLLDGGIERLMELGEVNTTERFRKMNIRNKPKIKVGISIQSDIMNLSVTSDDLEQEELLELLKNYQRKKKYYRLKNGDLISVSEKDMETLKQLMEFLQLSLKDFTKGDMKIPMYRALYLNKMLEQGENLYLNRDRHFKNLIKEFKTVDDSEFEVPQSLAPIMRGYQVYGFKWLKTLEQYGFGGILADDMGLGKTLQAISLLWDAKLNGKEGTALVVSPASLVYNWKEEFQKYAPGLKVSLVVGSQQERSEIIQNYKESDVLVTSYDLLKRDIAEYEETSFLYQILDEAQYIKNHSTAAAKSVKVIKSKCRLALTGTPIENRLSELWSIFDYLMPGFLYGYETFRKNLEIQIVKYKNEEVSERLKKMVSPFILRRLKGNVLADLPDKLEEIRYARLESEQQKLYDGQVIHMKTMLASQKSEDFQKNKLQILAELTKIRQICCDPELLFEKYGGGSAKREACMELIQSAIEGEHKILVFSQFTSMLSLLEQDLTKAGISYFKITGETAKEKRVEMVNTFNGDSTPVFLISFKAGGTGLNLTGADVVIHYDPWWNQAAQNQATDRAHRIGQTKAVSVYKLIVKDTIEEKIVKMQESKRDLADAILSGENGTISQMSKEEIMELLEG